MKRLHPRSGFHPTGSDFIAKPRFASPALRQCPACLDTQARSELIFGTASGGEMITSFISRKLEARSACLLTPAGISRAKRISLLLEKQKYHVCFANKFCETNISRLACKAYFPALRCKCVQSAKRTRRHQGTALRYKPLTAAGISRSAKLEHFKHEVHFTNSRLRIHFTAKLCFASYLIYLLSLSIAPFSSRET